MPRIKQPVPRGPSDPLKVKSFLDKWPHENRLTQADVDSVCIYAAWRGKMAAEAFAAAYGKDPRTAAALLAHVTKFTDATTPSLYVSMHLVEYLVVGRKGKLMAIHDPRVTDGEIAADMTRRAGFNIPESLVKKFRLAWSKERF